MTECCGIKESLEYSITCFYRPPYRDRYIENSPVFFDKVETPLLLIHGSLDVAVPPYLGDEIFVALRRLGKDVTNLRYPRGSHWEGDWQYSDMRDEFQRILEFLSAHLNGNREVVFEFVRPQLAQ